MRVESLGLLKLAYPRLTVVWLLEVFDETQQPKSMRVSMRVWIQY